MEAFDNIKPLSIRRNIRLLIIFDMQLTKCNRCTFDDRIALGLSEFQCFVVLQINNTMPCSMKVAESWMYSRDEFKIFNKFQKYYVPEKTAWTVVQEGLNQEFLLCKSCDKVNREFSFIFILLLLLLLLLFLFYFILF